MLEITTDYKKDTPKRFQILSNSSERSVQMGSVPFAATRWRHLRCGMPPYAEVLRVCSLGDSVDITCYSVLGQFFFILRWFVFSKDAR